MYDLQIVVAGDYSNYVVLFSHRFYSNYYIVFIY